MQEELIDRLNSRTDLNTVKIDDLLEAASLILENIVVEEQELTFTVTPEKIRKIEKLMPVIYLKRFNKFLFVNLHEFVYTPGVFETMFLIDDIEKSQENEGDRFEETVTRDRSGVGGRLSIVSKFPGIVDVIKDVIPWY